MLAIQCKAIRNALSGNTQFSTFQQAEHNYHSGLNMERKNRVRWVSRLARPRKGWISGIHFRQGQRTYRVQTGSAALRLHAAVLSVQLYCSYTSSGWAVLWLTPFVLEVHLVDLGHQLLCVIFLRRQFNNTACCLTFAALMKHFREPSIRVTFWR